MLQRCWVNRSYFIRNHISIMGTFIISLTKIARDSEPDKTGNKDRSLSGQLRTIEQLLLGAVEIVYSVGDPLLQGQKRISIVCVFKAWSMSHWLTGLQIRRPVSSNNTVSLP